MKKVLLCSTALAGVAAFAGSAAAFDTPTISLGGFNNFYAVYTSEDDEKYDVLVNGTNIGTVENSFDDHTFATDTELHVSVAGQADNGLAYGAKIEFEADAGNSANIDEAYTYLSGSWGRLEMGSNDGAGDMMEVLGPNGFTPSGGAIDGNWEVFNWTTSSGQVQYSTGKMWDTSDATKLTYLTPKLAGFQAGFSYAPQGSENFISGSTLLTVRSDRNPAALPSFSPTGSAKTGGRSNYDHYWEAGAKFSQNFSGVGLTVGGGYTHGEVQHNSPLMSVNALQAGAVVSYAGFSFGGSYANNFKSGLYRTNCSAAGNDCENGVAWTLGAQYENGPWVVGINYLNSEFEGDVTDPDNDKLWTIGVGGQYQLAPGLAAWLEVDWFNIESEYTGNNFVVSTTTTWSNYRGDNDGASVMLGTALSF